MPALRESGLEEGPVAGMERARIEPWLEGEEIADAIAVEIRELLEGAHRGERAADLTSGKAVRQGDRLLVSARTLVGAVRRRLVDDVLPQATIAEVAGAQLGMRESRPRFADSGSRPRAWSFPLPMAAAREYRGLDESASTKPVEEREGQSAFLDPVQGPQVLGDISHIKSGMQPGSDGPSKNAFSRGNTGQKSNEPDNAPHEASQSEVDARSWIVDPIQGRQVLSDISHVENEMRSGSNGRAKKRIFPEGR